MSLHHELSGDDAAIDICLAFLYFNIGYHILRATTDKSPKRSCWILTLLCSFVGVSGSLYAMLKGLSNNWNQSLMYGHDRISALFIRYFCTYFIVDLVYLSLHYPLESGWLHHSAYFMFMFASLVYSCTMIFVVFFPLEIPTIFLAIGHIWPNYRMDLTFGTTFFITRILYHAFLLYLMYCTMVISPFPFIYPATLSWLIHLYWFTKWSISQRKRSSRALR